VKFSFFAAFIAVFSSLALAAMPIEKFVNVSFEPDQNVAGFFLLPVNSSYVLVADGVETYVYDTGAGSAINDTARIADLLIADSKARNSFDSKVTLAQSFELSARLAKKTAESHCMQLTGTDMHDCTDKDTCVLACMSNPNCANPLYSDGFWEAILDWTTARKAFDASLSGFGSGIDAISTSATAIDSKIASLDELSKVEKNLSQGLLFLNRTDEGCFGKNATRRCYEYCTKIDYSGKAIPVQRQNLVALKAALLDMQNQTARANAIQNASAKNNQYLKSRGGDFASLKVDMAGDLLQLNKSYESLSEKVNDTQIPPMLASLSALSEKIVKAGKEGRYRAALSEKRNYESSYKAVSDRLDSDLSKYNAALSQIDGLNGKVNNSSWLIGAQSSSTYAAKLSALRENLTSSPATLQKIADISAEAGNISEGLSDDISAAASQGGAPSQQQQQAAGGKTGGLPCLPAFVLLAAGLFVAFREQGA